MSWKRNLQQRSIRSNTQLLTMILTLGQLPAVQTSTLSTGSHITESSFSRLPLDHLLFTNDVLLDVPARSRIACSKTCVETQGCVMSTFYHSPHGPTAKCRLFSKEHGESDDRETATGTTSFALRSVRKACRQGYMRRRGRCIRLGQSSLNYISAVSTCRKYDGELLITHTLEAVNSAASLLDGRECYWVGANDIQDRGNLTWSDGRPLPSSSPLWGTPSAFPPSLLYPTPACVCLRTRNPVRLSVKSCVSRNRFVCQPEAVQPKENLFEETDDEPLS